jgi:hypothetical protein
MTWSVLVAGRGPYALDGGSRIRTLVGIRRRIYSSLHVVGVDQ